MKSMHALILFLFVLFLNADLANTSKWKNIRLRSIICGDDCFDSNITPNNLTTGVQKCQDFCEDDDNCLEWILRYKTPSNLPIDLSNNTVSYLPKESKNRKAQ